MVKLLNTTWLRCGLWACAALAVAGAPDDAARPATLAFRIDEGRNFNSFLRDGAVAAHLLLRTGTEPRILVAFPAGNSAVGLWFADSAAPLVWTLVAPPRPLMAFDARRRDLNGIEFEVEANLRELRPRGAVLSSVRVLRDYELHGIAPAEVMVTARVEGNRVWWARDRLDGAAGYRLSIEGASGTRVTAERFLAGTGAPLRLKIQALSGDTPFTPLSTPLSSRAREDARARNVLAFLSYREKVLAGSWRFNTYFGRDTLISALLLAPVLEPHAAQSAIASVLDRLASNGEVAHEEDIGEFAVLRNAREGRGRVATPIYDYGMVDDDFLLAPLVARWFDDPRGRADARRFLADRGANGEERGAALVRNLTWVVERATPFAQRPISSNLVAIKPGRMTGQWRDSEQGLGRGRYAYDVNAALVPAALEAAARLVDGGLLDDHLDGAQRRTLLRARAHARVWMEQASALFAVEVPAGRARGEIAAYARSVDIEQQQASAAVGESAFQFHALSLDERGQPIPILHSDEGFRLLLTEPPPDELRRCLRAIMLPFPAGLMTDAGMLVANPALADDDIEREFSRFAYHGTVVWSWQQALMAAGIERQRRRADLPASLRAELERAAARLWEVIDRSSALRTSELWSWSYSAGRFQIEPFGRGVDADESNAAQLWSTVYLGL